MNKDIDYKDYLPKKLPFLVHRIFEICYIERMIVPIHTIFSVMALLVGAYIFFIKKGTSKHKILGYIYSLSMLALIVSSFWIFELWGSFGIYHIMSLVSFITLMIGLSFPLLFRHLSYWYIQHYIWMSYSYVGLLMAGGSHIFRLFPDTPSWILMLILWGLPYIVGSILIFSNLNKVKANQSYR